MLLAAGAAGAAASGFGRRADLMADGSGAAPTRPAPASDFAAVTFLAGGRSGFLGIGVPSTTGAGGGAAAITDLARTGAGLTDAPDPMAPVACGASFRFSFSTVRVARRFGGDTSASGAIGGSATAGDFARGAATAASAEGAVARRAAPAPGKSG
jgi:hypothetical protein